MPSSTLGTHFKRIRESKGIGLDLIHSRSKIPIGKLRNIENNDLDFLPAPYLLSFLKSMGKEIGLSETIVRQAFENRYDPEFLNTLLTHDGSQIVSREKVDIEEATPDNGSFSVKTTETEALPPGTQFKSNDMERWFHQFKGYLAGGIALIFVSILIGWLITKDEIQIADSTPVSFESIIEEIDSVEQNTALRPDVDVSEPTAINTSKLAIKIHTDTCWVSVRVPGGIPVERLMAAGQQLNLNGNGFLVTLGKTQNAGVFWNGTPVDLPKSFGILVNFRVGMVADNPPDTTSFIE